MTLIDDDINSFPSAASDKPKRLKYADLVRLVFCLQEELEKVEKDLHAHVIAPRLPSVRYQKDVDRLIDILQTTAGKLPFKTARKLMDMEAPEHDFRFSTIVRRAKSQDRRITDEIDRDDGRCHVLGYLH